MRKSLTIIALLGAAAGWRSAWAAPPPESAQRCVRIEGLTPPLEAARGFTALPRAERRARLLALLRSEAHRRSEAIVGRLRAGGARDVRLLWGAGVVCATAPAQLWDAVRLLPGAGDLFEDPPRPDELIDDAGSEPNQSVPPEAPLLALRVPEAWERGFTGRGVVVALIDTGVDMTHTDLVHQIWINVDEIPGDGADNDGNGYIDDVHGYDFTDRDGDPTDTAGHGTNAAGLLAGNGAGGTQTGVAPGVEIMVLRRGTTESALWEASQYAIENGADVISQSSSWRWSFSPRPDYASWRRQADAELAAGLIHVNSAGNNGESQYDDPIPYNISAPANCPPPWLPPDQDPRGGVSSVIAAGNVDARSLVVVGASAYGPAEWTDIRVHRDPAYPYTMPLQYRDYPNWGGANGLLKPDFVAQGENSTTTKKGGGYTTFGGTSAAAPRIAGVAALMWQAAPTATPAEIYQALATTARDLGAAGRDNRHGAGLPQADAAIDALGPALFVVSAAIVDPGRPQGDGDGYADAGEIDRLAVTLKNTSNLALADVDLVLTPVSSVIVRDGYARIASVPAGGTAGTLAPHFGIEFPAESCAQTAELRLEIRQGGRVRVQPLFVSVGRETQVDLLTTDFESDAGFTVSGTASAGAWVRTIPVGTTKNGQPANPAVDHTADPGAVCSVTGNGSTNPDAADVDGGRTTLTSAARNASGYQRVDLVYHRWFYTSDAAGEDRLLVEATNDGITWRLVESVSAFENSWRRVHFVLSDLFAPGAAARVRFSVEDLVADDTVEGGVDDFSLTGMSLDCTPWSVPSSPTPSPVGATLRLTRAPGDHLDLTWDPPSAGGGDDPQQGYRVTRSDQPDSGFAEVARPATTRWVELDGMNPAAGPLRCYVVESLGATP